MTPNGERPTHGQWPWDIALPIALLNSRHSMHKVIVQCCYVFILQLRVRRVRHGRI